MSEHIVEVEYDILNGTFSQKRREEIVRCRNCRALDLTDVDWRDWCFCRNFREYVQLSGFCAWGERRDA